MGQVHRTRFIHPCLISNFQLLPRKHETDLHLQRSGIPLLPIRTHITQHQGIICKISLRPELLVKTTHAAMQMIAPIIDSKLVFPALQRETPVGNPVGITSHQRPQISPRRRIFHSRVILRMFQPQKHIPPPAIFTSDQHPLECRSPSTDMHL